LLSEANLREQGQLEELRNLQIDLARALSDLKKQQKVMEVQRIRAEQRIAVLEGAIAQLSQPSETAQKKVQELTERLNAALAQAASEEQKRKELEKKYEARLADNTGFAQMDIPSKKIENSAQTTPIKHTEKSFYPR